MNYLYIFCKLICDKSKEEEDYGNDSDTTKTKSNNTPGLGLSKTGSFTPLEI